METKNLNKNLNEIFADKYVVPLYQRNYAWGEEEISLLLQDLYESFTRSKKTNYFIGSLVVLKRRNGDFEVIDGQQRLTTITLIYKILEIDEIKKSRLYYDSRPEVEAFFESFYRAANTADVTFDHKVSHLIQAVDIINETVLNPEDNIGKKISSLKLNKKEFDEFKEFFSKQVILVRVEIPEDTDVANYFEIMNNRGEQLQKHEILKASLIDKIKDENGKHDKKLSAVFSKIWDVCSQMDNHVQKLFFKEDRYNIFGENYDGFSHKFELEHEISENTENRHEEHTAINKNSIDYILEYPELANPRKTTFDDIDDENEDKSIIDFPNFLMHVLKLNYNEEFQNSPRNKDKQENKDIPLNEKDLLLVFNDLESVIDPMDFIIKLLYYRTIFDRYIIKASNDEKSEDDYKWSLERPYKYVYERTGQTSLKYRTSFSDQEIIIKCLSSLQVTYRNRKYKNWLQDVLGWFKDRKFVHIEAKDYEFKLKSLIWKYYNENEEYKGITLESNYSRGTNTPHFLFNYIDLLYWVDSQNNSNKNKFDFEFKYRNSIEHHLPQSFKNDDNKNSIDNLGNLCLVSKSSNSRMNNEEPKGKASVTGKYYKNTLPPKQKVIYDLTNGRNEWGVDQIKDHYENVVELLSRSKTILGIE